MKGYSYWFFLKLPFLHQENAQRLWDNFLCKCYCCFWPKQVIISFLGVIWRKLEYETGLGFLSILSGIHCTRLETVCGPTLVLCTVRARSLLSFLTVFQCLEIRAVLTPLVGLWENGGQEPPYFCVSSGHYPRMAKVLYPCM